MLRWEFSLGERCCKVACSKKFMHDFGFMSSGLHWSTFKNVTSELCRSLFIPPHNCRLFLQNAVQHSGCFSFKIRQQKLFDIFLTLIITGWSYCSDVCCCRWKKWDGEIVSTPTQSHSWWKRPSTFEHFYKNEIEIQWKARKKWIKILKGQVCIFPMLFCLWYHNVLVSSELCKCF